MPGIHWMPDVPTVTVNPGWFADNYHMAGLEKVLRADRNIPDFQIAQVRIWRSSSGPAASR